MPAKKSAACVALGAALCELRTEQGYSQERFAHHAGIDRSYYGAVERGEFNVTLDTIIKIADGLGTTVAELCDRANL